MRSSIVLAFIVLAAAFVSAEATSGSCADYFAQAALHSGRAAGDNHPHAVDTSLMNYEAICGTAPASTPVVVVIHTVNPYVLPTNIRCARGCGDEYLQKDYPDCSCYAKTYSCENACAVGEAQEPWPSCFCQQTAVVVERICEEKCQPTYTQAAYPACDCIRQVYIPHCENACGAGEAQQSFPDCRCAVQAQNQQQNTEQAGRPGDNHPR